MSTIARATRQLPMSYVCFLGFVLPQPSLSLPNSSLGQGVPGLVSEELVQERMEAADLCRTEACGYEVTGLDTKMFRP